MASVYQTKDGRQIDSEDVKLKSKCDFCGKLGEVPDQEDFIAGELPSLHSEGIAGEYADICRECLIEGVDKDELEEHIGTIEENMEETVELA